MNHKLETRIQKEIRMRAFERADLLRQKKEHLQGTEYTLDALQEVTGLSRPQLDSIADEVQLSLPRTNEGFFSIRNQILMTMGVGGFILFLSWCVYII